VQLPGALSVDRAGQVTGEPRMGVFRVEQRWLAQLPPEFYLRQLLELDLASDAALVSFMARFGLLASDAASEPDANPGLMVPRTTLARARESARRLRNASRALIANQGQMGVEDLWDAWETTGTNPRDSAVFAPDPFESAIVLAAGTITRALTSLGPSVRIRGWADTAETMGVPLETAIAVQMFNHLYEDADYRRCSFCGRTFVRQLGRAQKGQYKMRGVEYCSLSCARAAASRDYRMRMRAKRDQENAGAES